MKSDMATAPLEWFKSSYSSADGPDCVEVAISPTDATVHVRDSKDRRRTHLAFGRRAWSGFVGAWGARDAGRE